MFWPYSSPYVSSQPPKNSPLVCSVCTKSPQPFQPSSASAMCQWRSCWGGRFIQQPPLQQIPGWSILITAVEQLFHFYGLTIFGFGQSYRSRSCSESEASLLFSKDPGPSLNGKQGSRSGRLLVWAQIWPQFGQYSGSVQFLVKRPCGCTWFTWAQGQQGKPWTKDTAIYYMDKLQWLGKSKTFWAENGQSVQGN